MFILRVLKKDADRVREYLLKECKEFEDFDRGIYHEFINTEQNFIVKSDCFLGSSVLISESIYVAYLKNDLAVYTRFFDIDGESGIQRDPRARINWKAQTERAAKIELYKLLNVPQQDWIL